MASIKGLQIALIICLFSNSIGAQTIVDVYTKTDTIKSGRLLRFTLDRIYTDQGEVTYAEMNMINLSHDRFPQSLRENLEINNVLIYINNVPERYYSKFRLAEVRKNSKLLQIAGVGILSTILAINYNDSRKLQKWIDNGLNGDPPKIHDIHPAWPIAAGTLFTIGVAIELETY